MMHFWSKDENIKVMVVDHSIPCVHSTKFLGVFIDDTLSWKYHAGHLHNKLTMNRHMLSISKHKLDTDSLWKVHFSHIHSHLIYRIKAWGPSLLAESLDMLSKQQNKCVHIIGQGKSVIQLYKDLKIFKLPDMIKWEQSKLGYQLWNKQLPGPLQQLFYSWGGRKQHRYPTRNKSLPNVQQHSGKLFHLSFMCKCLASYSNLPLNLQRTQNICLFMKKTKLELLSSY